MPTSLDQILPSLASLGLWSYWIIGASAMFEAFLASGPFIPGTLIVVAGGMLVQQGALDFFDLVWFVAIGSILGGEASYWAGILARRGTRKRWQATQSTTYQKAERLLRRYGGPALVLGRFLGPLSGFVTFAAAIAGMERRRFVIWNIVSGFPFALALTATGLFLGDVLARLGPMATRVALFALMVVLAVAVLWWLILRIRRMLPFILSISRSILSAIGENPDVQSWAGRHPGLAAFLKSRLDTTHFFGLTATLLAAAFAYILLIWVGTALDFLMSQPVLLTDRRLANLMHAFWNPSLLRLFAHVTALGDWRVVTLTMLAALCVLLSRRRTDLMLALSVATLGNAASVALLKMAFHRPRPELAWFVETSGSFPSGHAAISVGFYGLLSYSFWRLRWLGPVRAAMLAATLAFLIGLSRLYLIEHYLSDVINGWLVGGMWLVIGIALAEWWRARHAGGPGGHGPARWPRRWRQALTAGASALLLSAAWVVATYDKPRAMRQTSSQAETVADPAALFASADAPTSTQSIGGTPLEPINVVIVARDRAAFVAAMQKAGWIRAARPGLATLGRAALAALTDTPDPAAPVTPYFWNTAPNDEAFQRPTDDNSVRERHHARFWLTQATLPDGRLILVGAASFDDGLDWNLLHHIDPNIDAERDTLVQDLTRAGVAARVTRIPLSPPRLGTSVAGDPWFTDGKAAVIELR